MLSKMFGFEKKIELRVKAITPKHKFDNEYYSTKKGLIRNTLKDILQLFKENTKNTVLIAKINISINKIIESCQYYFCSETFTNNTYHINNFKEYVEMIKETIKSVFSLNNPIYQQILDNLTHIKLILDSQVKYITEIEEIFRKEKQILYRKINKELENELN